MGIIAFATMGTNPTYFGISEVIVPHVMTVCVHTFPLWSPLWAEGMSQGKPLVIPQVRAIPPECINPRIKHRSRLHWMLADAEAGRSQPRASALVVDLQRRITETSSGNFFAVRDGAIVTPPPERCLGGISQAVVKELASDLKIPYREADLVPEDLRQASEAFTSSTPYCLMPVASVNGQTIGPRVPGPVYQKLIVAWNDLVGLDIIEQIQQTASNGNE